MPDYTYLRPENSRKPDSQIKDEFLNIYNSEYAEIESLVYNYIKSEIVDIVRKFYRDGTHDSVTPPSLLRRYYSCNFQLNIVRPNVCDMSHMRLIVDINKTVISRPDENLGMIHFPTEQHLITLVESLNSKLSKDKIEIYTLRSNGHPNNSAPSHTWRVSANLGKLL